MKITSKPHDLSQVRQIKGSFYVRQTKHGLVVSTWPKKRPKKRSPYEFYRQGEFAYAASQATKPEPVEYQTAISIAKGTLLMPRDILISAAYGNFWDLEFLDGTPIETRTMVAPNPQLMLDMISDDVGDMLVRTEVGWVALHRGNDGQFLGLVDGLPEWLDPQGGSAGAGYTLTAPPLAISTDAFATKGLIIEPLVDLKMTALSWCMTTAAGMNPTLMVVELNVNTISAILYPSTVVPLTIGEINILYQTFSTAIAFDVGKRYAILVTDASGTGTRVTQLFSSTAPYNGAPIKNTCQTYIRVANNAPTIGTVLSVGVGTTLKYAFTVGLDNN